MISSIVIPARLESTRLPRKLLLADTGKPLIQHTYESARKATLPRDVIVATDHEDIAYAIQQCGGISFMTAAELPSGTDRVAAVAQSLLDVDIVVNVQGDEPEIDGRSIDRCVELLEQDGQAVMATLASPIRSRQVLEDPNCVKVVFDDEGRALLFSRSPIPYARQWNDVLLSGDPPAYFLHIGLYAYRRDFLLGLAKRPVGRLESIECLEQLRVLEAGQTIKVGVIEQAAPGIDTRADYDAFVSRMRS